MLLFATQAVGAPTRLDLTMPSAEESPRHWVVFLARPVGEGSTAGHAFIEFGYEDEHARATKFEAWGFYPSTGDKGFDRVPGAIVDDVKSGSLAARTVIVSVAVTPEAFQAAMAAKQAWRTRPPEYHLFTEKNCIDFVDVVARAIGLETPDRSALQFPVDYVKVLAELND
jgi:hypothetical protein